MCALLTVVDSLAYRILPNYHRAKARPRLSAIHFVDRVARSLSLIIGSLVVFQVRIAITAIVARFIRAARLPAKAQRRF
jgi:hypothetical protein